MQAIYTCCIASYPLERLETSTTAEKGMRNAIDKVCRKTKTGTGTGVPYERPLPFIRYARACTCRTPVCVVVQRKLYYDTYRTSNGSCPQTDAHLSGPKNSIVVLWRNCSHSVHSTNTLRSSHSSSMTHPIVTYIVCL